MRKYNVGIIGCGDISQNYLMYAKDVYTDYFTVTAVADIKEDVAKMRAEQFGVPKHGLPEIIYNDPDIDIVINLTIPAVHEEISIKILESGKHVYTEKPLAPTREGMKRVMAKAKECGRRVGCAPDSFLSAPAQTAKKLIEEDWIGKPLGFAAFCWGRGNEFWHHNPDFYYKKGAGPMMDMAGYYLNTIVSLLGPIDSVMCMQKSTFDERTLKAGPRRGEKITVEVPTHVCSCISLENGVIGTFTNSFDIWHSQEPYIEIYGEKGTLSLPNPNNYSGELLVRRMNDTQWRPVPQFVEYEKYGRGIGIVDMIRSIELGLPHKASAELAYHVIETMLCIDESAETGKLVKVESTVDAPEGLYLTQDSFLWK